MAGAPGHVGETQGRKLCDKRSRRQFTLADALQASVHGVHAHVHAPSEPRGQAAAPQPLQVCEKDTSGMECPPGFCGHTGKSLPQRGSDTKKPQG